MLGSWRHPRRLQCPQQSLQGHFQGATPKPPLVGRLPRVPADSARETFATKAQGRRCCCRPAKAIHHGSSSSLSLAAPRSQWKCEELNAFHPCYFLFLQELCLGNSLRRPVQFSLPGDERTLTVKTPRAQRKRNLLHAQRSTPANSYSSCTSQRSPL